MHKRYFIVLAAAGVSAAALILAVVFGGQTTGVGESTAPRSPGDVDLPTVPDAAPGGPGSPGGAGGEVSAFTRRVGELEKGEVVFKQEGRRTILNYDELRPEADGVLRVTQPRARIIFSPRRMLEVRSQHGTVIAPEGQLLEGTFRGEVVTTFYEAPEGQTLDIDRSDHVLVRLYLDKAHYDDQIGRLVSDGPVFMTSPSVDAAGVGLSMTFNQLRQRLEQLVIRQGERIRFNPDVPRTGAGDRDDDATADAGDAGPDDAGNADEKTAGGSGGEGSGGGRQFYLARFVQDVDVNVAFGRAKLTGDQMQVVFAIASGSAPGIEDGDAPTSTETPSQTSRGGDAETSKNKTSGGETSGGGDAPADKLKTIAAQTTDPRLAPWDQRSLMKTSTGDVVVKWTGRMEINPADEGPQGFAGNDDALVAMVGKPMRIVTDQNETVEAARGDYLLSNGRIRAESSQDAGLLLDSPRLGIITGRAMEIVQNDETGWIDGPGSLLAATHNRGSADASKDLAVQWQGRLNLKFLTDAPAGDSPSTLDQLQTRQLSGITMAEFNGNVRVSHPQFRAAAQEFLRLNLVPVDNDDPQLREIEAAGDVRLTSLSDKPEQQIELLADALTLHFTEQAAGVKTTSPQPSHMFASGHVHAARPGYALDAGELYTRFTPTGDGGEDFEVSQVKAQANVKVHADQQKATLYGDRLTASTAEQKVEVYGTPETLARVVRADGVITGEHFIFEQTRESFRAVGPGAADLDVTQKDGSNLDVVVNWRDEMSYDAPQDELTFAGAVDATTTNATEKTHLTAQQLKLIFTKPVAGDATAEVPLSQPQPDAPAGDGELQQKPFGDRDLKTAVASGDVKFEAQSINKLRPDQPMTRLLLTGPRVVVDNLAQSVTVDGAGDLLVEDYRPAAPASDKPADGAIAAAGITGRGATLFKWQTNMTLGGADNGMVMKGAVQMVHAPMNRPRDERVRLTCRMLEASMQNAGGITGFGDGSRKSAEPNFKSIKASGDVRVDQNKRHIACDFLKYTDDTQTIVLWANPPHRATVTVDGEPNPLSADALKWNLAKDRFEAIGLDGGGIPIGR